MKTYYKITANLIKAIEPYIDVNEIKITIDEKNKEEYVEIIEEDNVGFKVFNNEIIVFYFNEHNHFEDYTSELQKGQECYEERAKAFFVDLFTVPLKHTKIYKGKKVISEKYYFLYSDGREEYQGGTWYGLFRVINPFIKKLEEYHILKYDKETHKFIDILKNK